MKNCYRANSKPIRLWGVVGLKGTICNLDCKASWAYHVFDGDDGSGDDDGNFNSLNPVLSTG